MSTHPLNIQNALQLLIFDQKKEFLALEILLNGKITLIILILYYPMNGFLRVEVQIILMKKIQILHILKAENIMYHWLLLHLQVAPPELFQTQL